ncbi:MAG: NAD-dependent epimerase/dehydratase family protein [Propylenella sp.]
MALVLVTGGSGFIGRHLVGALLSQGDEVRVLDVADAQRPGIDFVRGSVDDLGAVEQALDGVDCLYHLAGVAHLWQRDKGKYDRVNRRGTETVIGAAAERSIARVVHCSTESILLPKRRSGDAYVDESAEPRLEDMPGLYTRSKLLAERVALKAARGGLDVVVVNPTVPIGDGDSNRTPPAAMFSLFLSGGAPFFLDCVLNLVDVRDVADGIVRAGRHGRVGERYILGGENVRLSELLPILELKSGRRMPRRVLPAWVALATGIAAGWIADRVTHRPPAATREGVELALRSAPFDCSKARNELGYAPRSIDGALTEVVEGFKRERGGGDERGFRQHFDKQA